MAREVESRALPGATYRLQFNSAFTFSQAHQIVPYLAALGVTHAYASPYLRAQAGTSHGYDVVDHDSLHPELGSPADYEALVTALHEHGLGQLLDVVPNHMGVASCDNAWWMDVLENGPSSAYAAFFDIDWQPLKPDLAYKVLLPVLGDQFGKVLESGELKLCFENGSFAVRYRERQFPIAPRPAAAVLGHRLDRLVEPLGAENPHVLEYQSILTAIGHLPPRTETDPQKIAERRREVEVIKRRLNELCAAAPAVRDFILENVRIFNGTPGDVRSFDLLDRLLLDQAYRLAYWRVAADEINYRRFFDVNEMAAICMEHADVFARTHKLILRLVETGCVDGLRIDHPDGLFDPARYLVRLQEARVGQLARRVLLGNHVHAAASPPGGDSSTDGATAAASEIETAVQSLWHAQRLGDPASPLTRPLYVVVEKILGRGERIPKDWPVHGTTGYEFLNLLGGLFVDPSGAKPLDAVYARFIRRRTDFHDLVYQCKKQTMQASMSSEVTVLGHQLDRISEQDRSSRDFTLNSLTEAIREIIACFPVYRTYIDDSGPSDRDRQYVETAVARAKRKSPATSGSIFDFVRDVLLLRFPDGASDDAKAARRRFVGKFQQVTGPVMAKGVEDTAFYIYNRLVSLNEVGGDPAAFGATLAAFHQHNRERQSQAPHGLLSTTTHDTKRGEDVRARINVLSELPGLWKAHVFRWTRVNKRRKRDVDGDLAPSRNEEYLLYQTMIGTWPLEPLDAKAYDQYVERLCQYMLKAMREAKIHTSWISPNEPYERAAQDFVRAVLDDSPRNAFLADFRPLAWHVAQIGLWNSLSQTLLKLTCPGVPDVYQGGDLWDFRLVDPDNRGPVDFARRREYLDALRERSDREIDPDALVRELLDTRADGRIKLWLIWQVLNYRRAQSGLFTTGAYLPLDAAGQKSKHVCVFARTAPGRCVVVVAPRLVAALLARPDQPPCGPEIWQDTAVVLPPDACGVRFRNVLTCEDVDADGGPVRKISLAHALRRLPIALLEQIN
ncbi:MAG: malto-oligosyltrehalose synthase [Planctomycetia bacterium]|nr:malto-oligosyltrehalose synthase [Planctomycetia bacterium]